MRRVVWATAVLVLVLAGAPPAEAAPGDLDSTFDGDGIALSGVQDLDEFNASFAIAVQADGKVVVAGNDTSDVLVARFGTDGQLDPTFGEDGVATVDFTSGQFNTSAAGAVAIDGLGRIVVAGRASPASLAVARFTPSGDLDPTFSGDGRLLVLAGPLARVEDLVIDGSDRVLLAGWSLWCDQAPGCFEADGSRIIVVRLTAGGVQDPSFSGDGLRTLQPTGEDTANAIGLAPNGRILVAGALGPVPRPGLGDRRSFVVRLWPGGRLDGGYGRDGYARMNLVEGYDGLSRLAVGDDGTVTVVGTASGQERTRIVLARLRSTGTFAHSFSGDGRLLQDLGRGDEWGTGLALDADGRIVVGGSMRVGAGQRAVVLRFLADGSLDDAFSGNGWVPVDATPARDWGEGLALDPDGRAVLGLRTLDRLGAARVLPE